MGREESEGGREEGASERARKGGWEGGNEDDLKRVRARGALGLAAQGCHLVYNNPL